LSNASYGVRNVHVLQKPVHMKQFQNSLAALRYWDSSSVFTNILTPHYTWQRSRGGNKKLLTILVG